MCRGNRAYLYNIKIMTQRNKTVIQSLETQDNLKCVDIFQRRDSTFGFEEFRRDIEDATGWFPTGNYSNIIFLSAEKALEKAKDLVPWLNQKESTSRSQ